MQQKSTQFRFSLLGWQKLALLILMVFGMVQANAQVLFSEGFTTVSPLPTGWASQNNSSPLGTTGWLQGNTAVFNANSAPNNSFIAGNFNNAADGTISNWLFTPSVTLKNGDIFKFYTRVPTGGGQFPDRLQVRMSTNGTSTDVGTGAETLGDFTTLLLDINPTLNSTDFPETWTQYTITVSGLANPTPGRIAFRYYVTDAGPNSTNGNYMGIDDVSYTTFSSVCSGTPDPGNTLASVPSVCPTDNFTLSVSGNLSQSGLSYQWQTSSDGTTWNNIPGATNATYSTTQAVATYYRLSVTCSGGGTGFSVALQQPMSPATSCYCIPPATNCNLDDVILNVTLQGINNNSTCSTNGYIYYPTPVGTIYSGANNPMSVSVGPGGTERVGVWIDYDHSGSFDANEFTALGSGNGVTINGTIAVPSTALGGQTRMRVRVRFNTALTGGNACIGYTFGETEDYNVNIIPCVPVTFTAQPQSATTSCGGNATLTASVTGTFPSYKWQYFDVTTTPPSWQYVQNGGVYSGANTATLTITEAPSSLSGTQYRLEIAGGCAASTPSNTVTLTVNPLVATVNPASATICNGSSQQISITNTAAAPVDVSFASGPLSISVPDNTANGVSNDIIVSGIPAGATITKMSVTINMTHTYCGDMLFNLKAPNGSILALDKYLTGTAAQAGTYPNTGFVNTVISSAGTVALGTASAQPITGTFRADAINGNITGATVQNPAGFASNAANFAALYSVPNGTYTLAMADGGPADVGTLNNWKIDITYVAPTLATGVWAPLTDIYTDAGLTTPYTGTAVNTVYVNPTTTTNYSVVVTTNICTTAPLNIPITVANPVTNVVSADDASVCANDNTSFTVSADGNPIVYQWQVSTDGGNTWNNISNGGVYSGATTSTLNLTGVAAAYNGYQYRCVLSVSACSSTVNSDAATLTVNPNPTINLTAGPLTSLFPGLHTTLSAAVSPNPAANYVWFYNGNAISNTGSTLQVDIDGLGEYAVGVIDVNGCIGLSNTVTISDSSNNSLFIYPNPNTGLFQVRYYEKQKGISNPRIMNIYDAKGSRVHQQQFITNNPFGRMDVNASKLGRGVYVIELLDAGGVRLATGKVVIQ